MTTCERKMPEEFPHSLTPTLPADPEQLKVNEQLEELLARAREAEKNLQVVLSAYARVCKILERFLGTLNSCHYNIYADKDGETWISNFETDKTLESFLKETALGKTEIPPKEAPKVKKK